MTMPVANKRSLAVLSVDHGAHDLLPVAREVGADPARLPQFKELVVMAAADVGAVRGGCGVFLDGALGAGALVTAARRDLWIARQFPHGAADTGSELAGWPVGHVVKAIANARSDARTKLDVVLPELMRIGVICSAERRELLLEALPHESQTTAELVALLRQRGLDPAWWLVEAQRTREAWARLARAAGAGQGTCRGLIVIARSREVDLPFEIAREEPLVAGFVGGRAIFGPILRDWLAGAVGDADARAALADVLGGMATSWDHADVGASR